ncbi:hypothetical protein A6R68_20049, partial [Neotoma lepida]
HGLEVPTRQEKQKPPEQKQSWWLHQFFFLDVTRPVEVALFWSAIILDQLLYLLLFRVLVSCEGTHTLHYDLTI